MKLHMTKQVVWILAFIFKNRIRNSERKKNRKLHFKIRSTDNLKGVAN